MIGICHPNQDLDLYPRSFNLPAIKAHEICSPVDKITSFYQDMTSKKMMLNGTLYYDAWNAAAREEFYQFSKKVSRIQQRF